MTHVAAVFEFADSLSEEQWQALTQEIEQLACDFAAVNHDDRYEVRLYRSTP